MSRVELNSTLHWWLTTLPFLLFLQNARLTFHTTFLLMISYNLVYFFLKERYHNWRNTSSCVNPFGSSTRQQRGRVNRWHTTDERDDNKDEPKNKDEAKEKNRIEWRYLLLCCWSCSCQRKLTNERVNSHSTIVSLWEINRSSSFFSNSTIHSLTFLWSRKYDMTYLWLYLRNN